MLELHSYMDRHSQIPGSTNDFCYVVPLLTTSNGIFLCITGQLKDFREKRFEYYLYEKPHAFTCIRMPLDVVLPIYGYVPAEVSLPGSQVSSTPYHHNYSWSLGKGFNTQSGDMEGGRVK